MSTTWEKAENIMNSTKEIYCEVIVPLALERVYTYKVPEKFQKAVVPGILVVCQLGAKKLYSGIVYKISEIIPEFSNIKEIVSITCNTPVADHSQLEFWKWLSEYYACSIGEVSKAALPAMMRMESETQLFAESSSADYSSLSDTEKLILDIVEKKPGISLEDIQKNNKIKSIASIVTSLLKKDVLRTSEIIHEKFRPKTVQVLRLSERLNNEKSLNEELEVLKRAKKQYALLMHFLGKYGFAESIENTPVPKSEVIEGTNFSMPILSALISRDVFVEESKTISRVGPINSTIKNIPALSHAQNIALQQIETGFSKLPVCLLKGVTSSGKTEIYLSLAGKFLNEGAQVLFLLPEIALTTQIVQRLSAFAGNRLLVYHSKYSDNVRREIWDTVAGTDDIVNSVIIAGTRSAVFLPFKNLKLIIVDEEHDASYKQQDPAPRYNARDAAIMLAKIHNAKVLLGSATPSVESFYNSYTGKFSLIELNERYHNAVLPRLIIADIRESLRKKTMQSHFSPLLINAIKETLSANGQILLFQNRRGFSPYVECADCGYIPKCKKCNVSLTYHKHGGRLVCHYCGYSIHTVLKCPVCAETNIKTRGFGTEKAEDELALIFPDITVKRLDSDVAGSVKSYKSILDEFRKGLIKILVGTQMVTKGLDFENVLLVGILNADNMFNFPDYRTHERSYQTLVQVSGRAGRREKPGKVIIQTSDPAHPVIQDLIKEDYEWFYNSQIVIRKDFNYPPFCRLVKIEMKNRNEKLLMQFGNELFESINNVFPGKVLGPEIPFINFVRKQFLLNLLVKLNRDNYLSHSKEKLSALIKQLKERPQYRSVSVIFDIDPA